MTETKERLDAAIKQLDLVLEEKDAACEGQARYMVVLAKGAVESAREKLEE